MPPKTNKKTKKKILVIGAYGFIGAHVVNQLSKAGYQVIALGRDLKKARMVGPNWDWLQCDLRNMKSAKDWSSILHGFDFAVNCAGALQVTPDDDLNAVHTTAISALAQACARSSVSLIQISAAGAEHEAVTDFLATKAAGDAAIAASGASYIILRPGLVIADNSYGGSALLRMLAAIPYVQPVALKIANIQTVSIDDLTNTILKFVANELPQNQTLDLVEDEAHNLETVLLETRKWLGLKKPKTVVQIPNWSLNLLVAAADGLGRLGWRSPLRSNAIATLKSGVTGNPSQLKQLNGVPLLSLSQTYGSFSAKTEHRLHASMALIMPIVLALLFVFWLSSGVIGLFRIEQASEVLTSAGWSKGFAYLAVSFWSLIDIAIAAALLYRPRAKKACLAMIAVSLFYLLSATFITPHLWLDPLGPLIKALPSIGLAITAFILLEER